MKKESIPAWFPKYGWQFFFKYMLQAHVWDLENVHVLCDPAQNSDAGSSVPSKRISKCNQHTTNASTVLKFS